MEKDCRRQMGSEGTDRIGCVWVFMTMFDFRHGGSTQKLLTDKKRGSRRITVNGFFGSKHDKNDGGDEADLKADEADDECEEKLSELIKRLIVQEEGEIKNRKEEVEGLQILGSKEQSFREIEESGQKKRKFFNRKVKSNHDSEGSRTIVVSKPAEGNSRAKKGKNGGMGSSFLLSIFKRRLGSSAGKRPCDPAPDPVSGTDRSRRPEKVKRLDTANAVTGSDGLTIGESREETISGIYVAAKKHLSEKLTDRDSNVDFPRKVDVPRILGKILSLPEFSSPVDSPRQIPVLECCSNLTNIIETEEGQLKTQECESDDRSELLGSSSNGVCDEDVGKTDEILTTIDAPILLPGVSDTVMEAETMDKEEITLLDSFSEICDSSFVLQNVTDVDGVTSNWRNEDDEIQKPSKQTTGYERELLSSPPNSSIRTIECRENSVDFPGKLSPVSVLEQPFVDDDDSPKGSRSCSDTHKKSFQPVCIRFEEPNSPEADHDYDEMDDKESTLAFIRSVITSSESNWEKLCMKSFHSDQLLEPASMEDIEFCPNHLCDDKNLLLDCINEALMEFCGYWISYSKPTVWLISDIESIVKAAEEQIFRHISSSSFPRTLDQIVGKDMARTGDWMDLRCHIGRFVANTSEILLDELLEETIIINM